ncbi:hypothetical protein BDZ91DRAFT_727168 [Kalaharituber pfeilii]|nr:hypothetical protein BDZ91DRAFT_727168 [Kalaharituber pfeilii]
MKSVRDSHSELDLKASGTIKGPSAPDQDPQMQKFGVDKRWKFPLLLCVVYTLILLPSSAVLAMHVPIVDTYISRGHAEGFVFACILLALGGLTSLYTLFSCIALIFGFLSPAVTLALATLSMFAWGAAAGGDHIWWASHRDSICAGAEREVRNAGWRCEFGIITFACSCWTAAASLLLALMAAYILMKPSSSDQRKPAADLTVFRLGPPATPPVNLPHSRSDFYNIEVDSLLEEGSLSTPPRPRSLYNTTDRAEFKIARGEGKLILPQHLDPTSSGFIPGRLICGPSIPEPRPATQKNKGKQKSNGSLDIAEQGQQGGQLRRTREVLRNEMIRKSVFGEELMKNSPLQSQIFQASLGKGPILKPSPAVLQGPIPHTTAGSSNPRQAYYDSSIPNSYAGQSDYDHLHAGPSNSNQIVASFPTRTATQRSLRRISSAPPGGLQPRPQDPGAYYRNLTQNIGALAPPRPISEAQHPGTILPRGHQMVSPVNTQGSGYCKASAPIGPTGSTLTAGGARQSTPGVSSHTPRRSSNLTLSITAEELESNVANVTGRQGNWDQGISELLNRVSTELNSRSASLEPEPELSSRVPKTPFPSPSQQNEDVETWDEADGPRPINRQETFSSEESTDDLLDPEKEALIVEEIAEARRLAAEREKNPSVQEMVEQPHSPSLTLPLRRETRRLSAPMPLHIQTTPPVLSKDPENEMKMTTGRQASPNSRFASESKTGGGLGTTENDGSLGARRFRSTTVAPLTINKDLPPLPPIPNSVSPLSPSAAPLPVTPTPSTPRSPRTPIPELKTKCMGHFTVSPSGEVEMSMEDPDAPGSYRGRIESISTVSLGDALEQERGRNRSRSPPPSPLRRTPLTSALRNASASGRPLNEGQPYTRRRRSKSGPAGYVRFELSRNEFFSGGTWKSSSSDD